MKTKEFKDLENLNFEFKKIYIWKNTKLLLSSDMKYALFKVSDNGNICVINIW